MAQIRGTAGYNLGGSQNPFGGPNSNDTPSDPSPLDAIREQTSKIEDFLDTLSDPIKPYLPAIGRFLIVVTFIEDALRIITQWKDQLLYLHDYRHIPYGLTHMFLIINVIAMVSCSFLVITRKHSDYAVAGLIGVVITQALGYGLIFDMNFFLRNLSVMGGLLMVLSDSWIRKSKAFAGLPEIEEKDRKMYFQLAGRVLLIFLFIGFVFSGTWSIWRVFVAALGFVACVMVVVGFKAKFSATMLVVILSVFNLLVNNFWTLHEHHPHKDFAKYDFFQILSIVGGLLLLVNSGPGKYSIDEKKKNVRYLENPGSENRENRACSVQYHMQIVSYSVLPTSALKLPKPRKHSYILIANIELATEISGALSHGTRLAHCRMARMARMAGVFGSVWGMLVEVVLFWQSRFLGWLTRKKPVDFWYECLKQAQTYEQWEEAAFQLDVLLGNDLWRQNPTSKYYDYRLIHDRLQSIIIAREESDILQLVNLLRSGLVRNLGNITTPRLFNRAFAGTKILIEDYITQVAFAISHVATLPTSPGADGLSSIPGFNSQAKLDLLHDTRQAFGRSTLVLQGGAIFGLCHLGVVKALYLRGLLPRIITGTATGALIAALVGIHTEDELLEFLDGDGIDLTAFAGKTKPNGDNKKRQPGAVDGWWDTLKRRVKRFLREGYFLDVTVLEGCVRANVGDLTFEEAYNRTKRVLNITVATTGRGGVPSLLNYLTAPNVLIWSAAIASNAPSPSLYGKPIHLKCKDSTGAIVPWSTATDTTFHPWTHASYSDRDSPLSRIAELFNVNHFIVSQARPYLVPFLRSDMPGPSPLYTRRGRTSLIGGLLRLMTMEIHHRLSQLDSLSILPSSIRRFLVDEHIPAASVTLVPEISAGDFVRLLETPTRDSLDYWILRGEKSVWPAIGAIKVRCAVESELDRGYQFVRRRKAGGLRRRGSKVDNANEKERARANSAGAKW